MQPDKDDVMIEELIALKERLDEIWKFCFQRDSHFIEAMKDALKNSINKRQNVPAELLAKFVNKLLRTGSKVFTFPVVSLLF